MPDRRTEATATPDDVLARIDPNEVVAVALALGNIDSPTGSEGPAGEFVFRWLAGNGFSPKKYAMIAERFNVAAWIDGSGGGHSLIFNAHLDTTLRADAVWSARDPKDPLYHSAWVEGDNIYGDGVVNDKGPMAAFLVAAKAIKESGYPLKGDLIVSAVCGEISREPIEEWQGPLFMSKDRRVRGVGVRVPTAQHVQGGDGHDRPEGERQRDPQWLSLQPHERAAGRGVLRGHADPSRCESDGRP